MATSPAPDAAAPPGMCPGIAVLGGGGGSGDGDGDGSGGSGGAGGGGKGNGEGGEGDGKNSGTCGAGANGGCTNCKSSQSRGDPVDVVTGGVHTIPKLDFRLPGSFDLEFLRSFTNHRRTRDVGLGLGWNHSLAWSLDVGRRHTTVRAGDGRVVELPRLEVGQEAILGGWGIRRTQRRYVVRPGNEFIHFFEPVAPGSSHHKLVGVAYRNRGIISLHHDHQGRLVEVIDTAKRAILFAWNAGGHIESIRVPQPSGPTITFARYEYDDRRRLVAAIDADGHATRYGYDEDDRLLWLEYPSGITFRFRYGHDDRCVETWGEYPDGKDPALAPDAPAMLHDGKRAKGIYHCRFEYGRGYSEVVDSVRLQRFEAGPDGQVAKAVSARGGVTDRVFDESGNTVALTDPNAATWTWRYDALGLVVEESDPEGHAFRFARDAGGRPCEIVNPAGGVTTIQRDAFGEVVLVRDPAGGTLQFTLDDSGLVTKVIDQRGGQHRFEYDAHHNCVARTFPNGATYRSAYDWWGRLVAETNPLGAQTRYEYTDSGKLVGVTDALGRRTTLTYDSMGNLSAQTEPDGTTTRWEYAGLDWLYRVEYPDRTELRLQYNREGWLTRVINERGEKHELEYERGGSVTLERDFHGTVTRYGYDLRGDLVWVDRGQGRHVIERSAIGQVVKETAPDDSVQEFQYDTMGALVAATSGNVSFSFVRDVLGHVVREEHRIGARQYTVDTQRNIAGDRIGVSTSLGHQLELRRDVNGRVRELSDQRGRALAIDLSPHGYPVRRELAEGAELLDTYDAEGRLQWRRLVPVGGAAAPAPGQPAWVGARSGAIERYYEYTPVDEVRSVSSSDGSSVEYEYDVRRRLRRRRDNTGATEQYRVDATSNYYEDGPNVPGRRYGKGNQLLQRGNVEYRYDDRGQLAEKRVDGQVWRFEWNAWGQLAAVACPDGRRLEYDYDPFSRRMAKRVLSGNDVLSEQHYVWDLTSLLHEVSVDRSPRPAARRTYLYEEERSATPVGHRDDDSSSWVYYVLDLTGAPNALVSPSGKILGRMDRSTWGRSAPRPGSTAMTNVRFAGQIEDEETGLFYNRYRYYDPDAARYIGPDPAGIEAGLNLYRYGPNPVGWADPLGLVTAPHRMTVGKHQGFKPGDMNSAADRQAGRYVSGSGTCPPELDSLTDPIGEKDGPGHHTEQKFCHDLLEATSKAGKNKGRDLKQPYSLQGNYPPCPNCHAAMMRTAKETGADITYNWGGNSVTYQGGTGNPTNVQGANANSLMGAYSGIQLSDGGRNRAGTTPGEYWGATGITSGAHDAYDNMMRSEGHTK
ncbi:uncharacterized protein SOCE26_050880 [Sorangium cellulosum]|uniref:Uncharacterized protein n=2 Tax=Sorangium cellulosum TaxID=56 RepID=A0A2L0EWG7_SORCE|nr:uncharacterized protein SOCE26_050880 [Sorangium cellulosum]